VWYFYVNDSNFDIKGGDAPCGNGFGGLLAAAAVSNQTMQKERRRLPPFLLSFFVKCDKVTHERR
jgi:hypothetical protein